MAPTSATDYTLPDDDTRLCAMLARRPMLQRLPRIRLAHTRFSDPEGPIQASLADRHQANHTCGEVER